MAFSMEPSRSTADEELEKFRGDDVNDNDDSGRDKPHSGGVLGTENSATVSFVEPATGDDDDAGDGETSLCIIGSHFIREHPRGTELPLSSPRSISASVTKKQLLASRDWLVPAQSVKSPCAPGDSRELGADRILDYRR
ncbi:hypothetical protein V2A60_007074 [Cordyceps javanica]